MSAEMISKAWHAHNAARRGFGNTSVLASHTIAPSPHESAFGGSALQVPASVIDLFLVDDSVRGICFHLASGRLRHDVMVEGDLSRQPNKGRLSRRSGGHHPRAALSIADGPAYVLSGIAMDIHRMVCIQEPNHLDSGPPEIDFSFGFPPDELPEINQDALKRRVWEMLSPGGPQPDICYSQHDGLVSSVTDGPGGSRIVRLGDGIDRLCPRWGECHSRPGKKVVSGTLLFSMSLRRAVYNDLDLRGAQLGDRWAVLSDHLGEDDTRIALEMAAKMGVREHLGRVFVADDLLPEGVSIAGLPVYRDVSRQLRRVLRRPSSPQALFDHACIGAMNARHGRLRSWFVGDHEVRGTYENALEVTSRFGSVSL